MGVTFITLLTLVSFCGISAIMPCKYVSDEITAVSVFIKSFLSFFISAFAPPMPLTLNGVSGSTGVLPEPAA